MALGTRQNNTNNGTDQQDEQQFHEHKFLGDWADIIARWVVDLFAIPISFITAIFAQFVERDGSGAKVLGSIAFWIGTLLSTDGIWQMMFQGTPLFPWFGAIRLVETLAI